MKFFKKKILNNTTNKTFKSLRIINKTIIEKESLKYNRLRF